MHEDARMTKVAYAYTVSLSRQVPTFQGAETAHAPVRDQFSNHPLDS